MRAQAACLLDAVSKGAFARAAYLLREKAADPNMQDQSGRLTKRICLLKRPVARYDSLNLKGASALHLAALTGDAKMCALLLCHGADSNKESHFEGLDIDRKLYTPYRVAETGSAAEDLLALLKAKLQINNIRSSLPINMTHRAKDKLILAMRPFVNDGFNESLTLSQQTETMLLRSDLSTKDKQTQLTEKIKDLGSHQFLWLSNGFRGHAVDLIVHNSHADGLLLVIANRGNYAMQYHSLAKIGSLVQIFPKVYSIHQANLKANLNSVIHCLAGAIATTYSDFKSDFFVDGQEFYNRFNLSSQFPAVQELRQYGPPGIPQVLNNCTTLSLWTAVDYLLSAEGVKPAQHLSEWVYNAYQAALDQEIQESVSGLSYDHLNSIVTHAKSLDKTSFNLSHMLFLIAQESSMEKAEKLHLYSEARTAYQNILDEDNGGPELEQPLTKNTQMFISQQIKKCDLQIKSLQDTSKVSGKETGDNHLYWFTKPLFVNNQSN